MRRALEHRQLQLRSAMIGIDWIRRFRADQCAFREGRCQWFSRYCRPPMRYRSRQAVPTAITVNLALPLPGQRVCQRLCASSRLFAVTRVSNTIAAQSCRRCDWRDFRPRRILHLRIELVRRRRTRPLPRRQRAGDSGSSTGADTQPPVFINFRADYLFARCSMRCRQRRHRTVQCASGAVVSGVHYVSPGF